MLKVHYYTDCPFFAGCEGMLANFFNDNDFAQAHKIHLYYRHSAQYKEGLDKRIENLFRATPIHFPDLSVITNVTKQKKPSLFKRAILNALRLVLTGPLFIYEVIYLFLVFRKDMPDVLHINNGGYPAALSARAAAIAGNFAGVNAIVMVVNNLAEGYKRPSRWLDYPIDWIVKRCVTQFITGSTVAAEQLKAVLNLSAGHVEAIHNGIAVKPLTESRGQTLGRLNLSHFDGVLLGVVALLIPRKGHQVLLDAMLKLKTEGALAHQKIKVLIEGGGPLQQSLTDFVKKHDLSQWIVFVGEEKNIVNLMSTIDVLILPSVANEDFPNVIIEAMALGKPVIASRLAGTPEQVVDGVTGRLVAPRDAGGLADAICALVEQSDRLKSIGDAALARYNECFSREIALSNYAKMYMKLVTKKKQ